MGFYFRKSLNFGGLRFNFSKSGLGVSVGFKGFRLGSGPKGNYVHMGRHGFYYRAVLGGKKRHRNVNGFAQDVPFQPQTRESGLNFVEIESADVSQIIDSDSEDLINEIRIKHKRLSLWPIPLLFIFIIPSSTLLWILLSILIRNFIDKYRKTVVIVYDIDEFTEKKLQEFYDSFDEIIKCSKKWHISAEALTDDYKYNSGASTIVRRKAINIDYSCPKNIKTNVRVPCIPAGRQKLYFFPDKVLIYEGKKVGAVSYSNLEIFQRNKRFIEEERVPADGTIVDSTWKYLNKKGGPDRRFSDNRQLPILLYSEITFFSNSGLNEKIQLSRCDAGRSLVEKLAEIKDMFNMK